MLGNVITILVIKEKPQLQKNNKKYEGFADSDNGHGKTGGSSWPAWGLKSQKVHCKQYAGENLCESKYDYRQLKRTQCHVQAPDSRPAPSHIHGDMTLGNFFN